MNRLLPNFLIGCWVILISCTNDVYENRTIKLNGKIINPDATLKDVSLSINRLGFDQEEMVSLVDSAGNYEFTFESSVPLDAWLHYQTNILVALHPGDSLHVQFDGSEKERSAVLRSSVYTGNNVSTTIQVSQFEEIYYKDFYAGWKKKDSASKHFNPDRFRVFADSVRAERYKIYEAFVTLYSPNEEAKSWARQQLEGDWLYDLTFYPNSHREALLLKQSDWDVPNSYYDYFKSLERITNSTSAAAIWATTDKYVHRYIKTLAIKSDPKVFLKSPFSKDSAFYSNIVKSTQDPLLKEIALTQYFGFSLSELNVDFFEKNENELKSQISHSFLWAPLVKQYRKTKKEINESFLNQDSRLIHLENKNNFLNDVISSHKGQYLFIDVWATWCGPCIEEFAYAKDLQEELKEVTFIYLCIDSKEKLYLNALKKYQLKGDHYYLTDTQSDSLRKDFNIDGIPFYLLVNKAGTIVSSGNEVRPSDVSVSTKVRKLISGL